jgi:hypothetical protein
MKKAGSVSDEIALLCKLTGRGRNVLPAVFFRGII